MENLGEFIRDWRINVLKMSLRAFCLKHGQDAGNWSKMERNMREAPEIKTLAAMLAIAPNSPDWEKLQDLVTTHQIRKHLTDEEIVQRLPVALRATKMLSEAQLEQLKIDLKES